LIKKLSMHGFMTFAAASAIGSMRTEKGEKLRSTTVISEKRDLSKISSFLR
jgi:hypothetical protein